MVKRINVNRLKSTYTSIDWGSRQYRCLLTYETGIKVFFLFDGETSYILLKRPYYRLYNVSPLVQWIYFTVQRPFLLLFLDRRTPLFLYTTVMLNMNKPFGVFRIKSFLIFPFIVLFEYTHVYIYI